MRAEASRRVHIGPGHERRGGGWGERGIEERRGQVTTRRSEDQESSRQV